MSEHRVRIIDIDTDEVLSTHEPFFIRSRAEYNAKKLSRVHHSPHIIASAEVHTTDGWRKVCVYRMGRIFKL